MNLAKQLNIANVGDYNNLVERTAEFNKKLEQRAKELQEDGQQIMENMKQDPSNRELLIDYTLATEGAIKLLEMRNGYNKMVNQIAEELGYI